MGGVRERERASEQRRDREREGERIQSRLCTDAVNAEPDIRLELTNCEIMT